jgi:manganese transport protein
MLKRLRSLGPGLIVMAAFMGPGSVTVASVSGANFGFAVAWSVVFATVATIILQEMSARLGLVSREGLGEALRTTFRNPLFKIFAVILVLSAIAVGNLAFTTGNVTGSATGLSILTGLPSGACVVISALVVIALLFVGRYRIIERVLIAMVIVMSVVFLVTAIIVRPDVGALLRGLVIPAIPAGSLIPVVGLIGSTVVPYNLFLHASSVQEKWPESVPTREALAESRLDTSFSITVGGIITLAIMATAATAFFERGIGIESAVDMAEQLEPVMGPAAEYFFATGFMAAGLTSAITAPLAAAYATQGVLSWERNLQSWKFRAVWIAVLLVGATFAFLGTNPVAVIIFAQFAAGLSLPVIGVFLLIAMNRSDKLGEYRNGILANILGAVVVLVVAGLGLNEILGAVGAV